MADPILEHQKSVTRRHFFGKLSIGLGTLALGSLMVPAILDRYKKGSLTMGSMPIQGPHFAPKAKRVIYLFQNGAPSQLETFDYKPKLIDMFGQDLPASIRMGQRLTGMTSGQERFPLVGSKFAFEQHGQSGI